MTWKFRLNCMLIVASVVYCTVAQTARILFIIAPVYSHCKSFDDIGRSLDNIGHDLFAYIPNQWELKDCLNERHITIMKYEPSIQIGDPDAATGNELEKLRLFSNVLCSAVFRDQNSLNKLATMKFDLVVVDTFPLSKCYLLIPYKFNISFVSFSPVHWWFDVSKPFCPQMENPVFSPPGKLIFMQRVKNALAMLSNAFVLPWYFLGDPEVHFAPELSYFEYISLIRRAALFIQDDDVILSGALPVMPNTVYTGGFSPRPVQPLPQEIETFVSSAKDGVIVVSFGSFSIIPENVIQAMGDVFSSLPHHILIKSKQDFHLRNVMTMDWIPQNDILGHNNTKLFISHCGRNGAYEAIYHGVPVVCIPLFGDQPLVAFNIERLRIGISVDVGSLNTDRLRSALVTVLSITFETKAKHVSSLYKHIHPKSAGDTAAEAIDIVIKYGGDHLRPEAMDLSIFSFLLLDIWLLLLGLFLSMLVTSWLFCRWVYSVTISRKVKQD